MKLHQLLCAFAISTAAMGTACAEEPTDDVGATEDALTNAADVVGTLAVGQSANVAHPGGKGSRALRLELAAGAAVDLQVTAEDGAPIAYLLKSDFTSLGRHTGVAGTTGARITQTVKSAGTYYLAMREAAGKAVTFRASYLAPGAAVHTCRVDAECGGGSARCVLERCMAVSSSSMRAKEDNSAIHLDRLELAFDHGKLLYGYGDYNPFSLNGVREGRVRFGTWPVPATERYNMIRWEMFRTAGAPATVVYTEDYSTGNATAVAGEDRFFDDDRTMAIGKGIGYAKDPDGRQFAAFYRKTGTRLDLYYSERGPNQWSAGEKVATGLLADYGNDRIILHPRATGSADILISADNVIGGDARRFTRSASGTWSAVPAGFRGQDLSAISAGKGRTYLLAGASFYEIADTGTAEDRGLIGGDLHDMNVDDAGNVYVLRDQVYPSYPQRSLVIVPRHGHKSELVLDRVNTAAYPRYALAVSPAGEIALAAPLEGGTFQMTHYKPLP